jgi:uncharacterized protein
LPDGPFEIVAGGLVVHVRLTPKAAFDRIEGVDVRDDGMPVLKARVRAVPEDSKANKALLKLLSKNLSHPVGKLSLVAGHKSRIKRILVAGDGRDLAKRMRKFLEQN